MKKKFSFRDILFEPEEPEIEEEETEVEEEPVKPVVSKAQTNKEPEPAEKTTTIKAEDVLYKKSQTFIDYINSPVAQPEKKAEQNKEEEVYEFSTNISPIFGVIEPREKKETPVKTNVVTSQVNKPEDYHLDIVPSPIYGYSSKEEAEKENYTVNNLEEEISDDEMHSLFETQDSLHVKDVEINLFDSYEEEE